MTDVSNKQIIFITRKYLQFRLQCFKDLCWLYQLLSNWKDQSEWVWSISNKGVFLQLLYCFYNYDIVILTKFEIYVFYFVCIHSKDLNCACFQRFAIPIPRSDLVLCSDSLNDNSYILLNMTISPQIQVIIIMEFVRIPRSSTTSVEVACMLYIWSNTNYSA